MRHQPPRCQNWSRPLAVFTRNHLEQTLSPTVSCCSLRTRLVFRQPVWSLDNPDTYTFHIPAYCKNTTLREERSCRSSICVPGSSTRLVCEAEVDHGPRVRLQSGSSAPRPKWPPRGPTTPLTVLPIRIVLLLRGQSAHQTNSLKLIPTHVQISYAFLLFENAKTALRYDVIARNRHMCPLHSWCSVSTSYY